MGCEAKTALPNCAAEKVSPRASTSAKPALGVQMVQGLHGGRQEAPGRRYCAAVIENDGCAAAIGRVVGHDGHLVALLEIDFILTSRTL